MSHVAPSANFRDPLGLLLRMLKSGNRAAYAALSREALSYGAKPLDAVLSLFERRLVSKNTESQHPLIFIIGAPRSGTTLVYQALSYYLNVSSPSNLSALFPKAPLTASRMHQWLPSTGQPNFRNFYGQTTNLTGPNDAFHIWNRWLGDDRYSVTETLSSEAADDMRRFFAAWTETFDRPFLNKNNRNTSCIRLLSETLQNAKFVVVRRNPLFVAQSLIKARQQVQGDKSVGWGLQSSSTGDHADPLAYVNDVCRQIAEIDQNMETQLAAVDVDRVMHLTYESFCEHPRETIGDIALKFDGVELNPDAAFHELSAFEVSQKTTLSPEEQQRVFERLGPGNRPGRSQALTTL